MSESITQKEIVEIFFDGLEELLKHKIIEQIETIKFIKQQKIIEKENNSLPFQKAWQKALEEEYKEEEKKWEAYYFQKVKEIVKSSHIQDKEFAKRFYYLWAQINLQKLQENIQKTKYRIALLKMKSPSYVPPKNSISQNDVDIARRVELSRFLGNESRRRLIICPFHNERTGSFKVYNDSRFKCFGCGEYGDVITFVQKTQQLNFKEAVQFLLTFN